MYDKICKNICQLQGAWKPSLNIGSLLTTIQLLMSEPNPDDPLMSDIVSLVLLHQFFTLLKVLLILCIKTR